LSFIISSMQITKTNKTIISGIVIIILFGIYVFFDRKSKEQEQTTVANTDQVVAPTTITDSKNIISAESTGGTYKIEQVPIVENKGVPQPIPDLNRPVTSADYVPVSPEAKARASENILALQENLKKNPVDLPAWLDLGMYQKMAGDYQGTVLSWQYAGKISPANFISFANLGNLYAYFLKDNGLAEMYYKQAISKDSTQSYLYTQLAEVYRDIFKDNAKAKVIIDEGLSKIPNDVNLLQMKASLSTL